MSVDSLFSASGLASEHLDLCTFSFRFHILAASSPMFWMWSVPFMMRGGVRSALRIALQEIVDGTEAQSEVRTVRGWKLLLLLPRRHN